MECNKCSKIVDPRETKLVCEECVGKEKEDIKCTVCGKKNFESPYSRIRCLSCFDPINGVDKEKETEDTINKPNHKEIIKPSHYHDGTFVDPIRFGKEHFTHEEMKGFYKMNVIKYITRSDKKNGLEDLIKAKNYLEMLIENVENDDE